MVFATFLYLTNSLIAYLHTVDLMKKENVELDEFDDAQHDWPTRGALVP